MANMKSFLGAASAAAILALGLSSGAKADENKFGYSITLTGVSDYLFRGISLTSNDPAFQPFIEFTYGNPNLTWYFDLWGSNVKNGLGDPWELDFYAGVRPVFGPLAFDLGVLYYTNPQAHNAANLDYVEFKAAATYAVTSAFSIGVTGYVTPDVGFAIPVTETIEGNAAYTLPQFHIFTPTVSGLIGYTNGETSGFYPKGTPVFDTYGGGGVTSYTYWNAGVKLAADKFFLDLRYWDTSISKTADPTDLAQAKFLFSFGVTLP